MRVRARISESLALTCVLAAFSPHSAAQPVLQEVQRIAVPAGYFGAGDVCLRGDDLLVLTRARGSSPELEGVWALIHFRRQADGSWQFVREVAAVAYDANDDIWSLEDLECEGALAAFSTPRGDSYAVELTSAGWQAHRLPGLDRGSDASVFRDTVAIAGSWRGPTTVALVRKDASGAWTNVTYAEGNPGSRSDSEFDGPGAAWVAETEIIAGQNTYAPPGAQTEITDTQVLDLIDGTWRVTTTRPEGFLPGAVIGNRAALNLRMWTELGDVASYFVRDGSGAWTVKHSLLSDEFISPLDAVFLGERVFASIGRNDGEIGVFRQEAPGRYRHAATLSPSNLADSVSRRLSNFSVDGERVAAGGSGISEVYLFDAPSTLPAPQLLQKTFENDGAADWAFSGDADWRIVSSGGSRVLRQSRTTGAAFAILSTSEGDNQSIQADVRINELGTGTPWAGFVLRYTNSQNYYYLLINRTSVQIRKIVNGSYSQIATAPLSLVLGRWYNFRLEAIGSRLRMFVNGAVVGEVIDDAHGAGRAGMMMWRARTDYDNVIVSDRPQTDLHLDTFNGIFDETRRPWKTVAPAGAWSLAPVGSNDNVYRQNLISGGPRSVNGGATGDQIVSVNVRPTAFNSAGNGWVGVMARYVDNFNNYFVMLHQSGRASVRKRINGVYTALEEVPFTVRANTTYRVRIEAIGASLRVYVNERLLAEGVDDDLASGSYGLVTFNATADFDNFKAVRP